ncbi:MAG: PKD domain-containing protein [Bacteroidetes bacterium]|nr:PKD domain-containing protein [Bacteroidota bacterium]
MKKFVTTCFLLFCFWDAFATHIIGGEMRYEYIGPGVAPNSKQYRIRLLLLRGPTGAAFINQYIVGVFNNDDGSKVIGTAANNNWAAVEDFAGALPVPILISPCIQPPPVLDYTYKTYSFVIELPDNNNGYTVAFQTFSRQNSNNVNANQGANYSCIVPGLSTLPNPLTDNSPAYKLPISAICANSPFSLDFSAIDQDGDSLVYNFCNAYDGGAASLADFQNPAPPPYNSVIYTPPYNALRPMGNQVTIDPHTGIISGIAPSTGKYVVCVCASVYKNGNFITVHRKDLIVEVSACTPLQAIPNFNPITCDGFTVTFNQSSTGNPDAFYWDFGDPASGINNTSTIATPTHTFTAAGVFNVKLRVSIQGQCVDSIIRPLSVFPGFTPGFKISSLLCSGQPVQFTDTSRTAYGVVDSWAWDFGDLTTLADTSHLQNPVYTYAPPGATYNVKLVVTNSKGCRDSVITPITITDPPAVAVFPKDTTFCGRDTITVTGTGTGSFVWTPNINIIGATTATPQVFPSVPTKYYATLTSSFGCSSVDSLTVTPKQDVTNNFTGPANICEEDTVTLTGTSNYSTNVSWQWTPVAGIESPTSSTTRAYPSVTTTYTLFTTWGKNCVARTSNTITVKPLAIPNAGPSKVICGNDPPVQLTASGGDTYVWTPATSLSNPNIANPMASPTTTTIYYVAVGVTGCAKTRSDSLVVTVQPFPALSVMGDTLICNIDTLQVNSTGTGSFTWSPNYMISNINAQNPLVSPDVPTRYYVTLSDVYGCQTRDSIFIDVKDHVTVYAGNDTTICRTDGILLGTIGDALHYKWVPSTYLDNDTLMHPHATPLTSITYQVIANIGKCQSSDDIAIKVVPYPPANAGLDTSVCPGFSAPLFATGGSSYLWTPATFLTNRNIQNPVAVRPTASIMYIVAVTDTLGCPKPVKDTVWVNVYPPPKADAGPRDTSVVLGEPLQLHGTGGVDYLWDPATWLNNSGIANPIALPQDNIQYILTATTAGGCVSRDTIMVHLFKFDPDIYVPTAFTPNKDGANDVLRPILIGMKELHYFKVYNRFGNLMYSTTEIGQGWDGIYNGRPQDPATFVWYAEGITYKGECRFKKGYAVLIR